MKILLVAGVFYPDVGGPAIHVAKIAERLSKEGLKPLVICYGDDLENKKFSFKIKRISRRYPKILQWFLYLFTVLKETIDSKIIYAFDPTATGLPACIASRIFRKPFFIRIGGDPIWEREAEMGRRIMPITTYYDKELYKQDKPILFKIIKTILNRADKVVFYNNFWKNFAEKYYNLPDEKIIIIKNPVFRREKANPVLINDPLIIFAGRFVIYKNLPRVMKVFDQVRQKLGRGKLLFIGKGPELSDLLDLKQSLGSGQYIEFLESLPQEKLFEKIKESSIAIGPAFSEFNPNFILESLSFGKPVLLSRGHGLSVDLPEEFLFDPLDSLELQNKIEYLFDPENYKNAVDVVNKLDMNQTWDNVTDMHLSTIKQFIKI